ncbi:MAG: SRPBCC family protein [Nocardioidaceae bacterium]
MSKTADVPDRIEREILIDAPVERVWQLVSEPGWWIGDGDPSRRTVEHDGDVVIVDFPPYGRFPVLLESSDAPRYIAYRSADDGTRVPAEDNSTLVEFFLSEQPGGTLLRVVESGFEVLYPSTERRATAVEGNVEGWRIQLGLAKQDAERDAA